MLRSFGTTQDGCATHSPIGAKRGGAAPKYFEPSSECIGGLGSYLPKTSGEARSMSKGINSHNALFCPPLKKETYHLRPLEPLREGGVASAIPTRWLDTPPYRLSKHENEIAWMRTRSEILGSSCKLAIRGRKARRFPRHRNFQFRFAR